MFQRISKKTFPLILKGSFGGAHFISVVMSRRSLYKTFMATDYYGMVKYSVE